MTCSFHEFSLSLTLVCSRLLDGRLGRIWTPSHLNSLASILTPEVDSFSTSGGEFSMCQPWCASSSSLQELAPENCLPALRLSHNSDIVPMANPGPPQSRPTISSRAGAKQLLPAGAILCCLASPQAAAQAATRCSLLRGQCPTRKVAPHSAI